MKIPTKNFTLAKTYFKTNIRTGGFEERNDFPQEFDVKTVDNQIISNQWVGLIKILRTIGGYSLMDAKHKVDACRHFDALDGERRFPKHSLALDRNAMWTEIMDTIDKHNEIVVKKEEKKEKTKIVIHVEGGNIQSVHTNHIDDIEIQIVDYDNLEAEGKDASERLEIFCRAVSGLTII
jgi:hypothetical protein